MKRTADGQRAKRAWAATLALAIIGLAAAASPASAQGFCDGAYLSVGSGSAATVYRLDFDGTTLDFVPVASVGIALNAWDINPIDGLIYGTDLTTRTMHRVDGAGSTTNITPPGWDTSTDSVGAGISGDGSTWTVIKVDHNNGSAREFCNVDITVGPPFSFACANAEPNAIMTDGVYEGFAFYTVGGPTGRLRRTDPASGSGADIRDDLPESIPGGYGTLFSGPNGDLFTYGNATRQLLHLDAASGYDWSVLTTSDLAVGHTDGGTCNFVGFCGPDADGDGTGDNCESDLGDLVWYDTNQNGVQSPGEPGLAGATVELFASPDCSGSAGWSVASDAAGAWEVETVPPSPNARTESYCLEFTLPSGIAWIWSPRQAGGDPELDSNVDADGRQTGVRVFSFDDLTRDAGAFANGQIAGQVYCDENENGAPDPGEGLAGVTVELYADTGCDGSTGGDAVIRSAATDDGGGYAYTPDVPAGPPTGPALCYQTELDESSLPASCNTVILVPPLCELTADAASCVEEIVVQPPVPVELQAFSVE